MIGSVALRSDHKLIPVPMSAEYIRLIHAGMKRMNYTNRSDFIRDAIREKLDRGGFNVPPDVAGPPQRAKDPTSGLGSSKKGKPEPPMDSHRTQPPGGGVVYHLPPPAPAFLNGQDLPVAGAPQGACKPPARA